MTWRKCLFGILLAAEMILFRPYVLAMEADPQAICNGSFNAQASEILKVESQKGSAWVFRLSTNPTQGLKLSPDETATLLTFIIAPPLRHSEGRFELLSQKPDRSMIRLLLNQTDSPRTFTVSYAERIDQTGQGEYFDRLQKAFPDRVEFRSSRGRLCEKHVGVRYATQMKMALKHRLSLYTVEEVLNRPNLIFTYNGDRTIAESMDPEGRKILVALKKAKGAKFELISAYYPSNSLLTYPPHEARTLDHAFTFGFEKQLKAGDLLLSSF